MTCIEYRQRLLGGERADPASVAHAAACPPCAAFARSVAALDATLDEALQAPVPPELADRILLDRHLRSRRHVMGMAAAASLAALALAGGVAYRTRRTAAADVAIDHVLQDPEATRGASDIAPGQVIEAFASWGGRLHGSIGKVTFCRVCPVPGGLAHHLVVSLPEAMATILLLPPYDLTGREFRSRAGLVALVTPAGRGTLGIVATERPMVEAVEWLVARQVTWS